MIYISKTNNIIRYSIVLCSIIIAVFMKLHTSLDFYENYFLVPLLFGLILVFTKYINLTNMKCLGPFILNYSMIIKYTLSPLISCVGKYKSWLGVFPKTNSIKIAIFFIIIEMFFLLIMSNILYKMYTRKIKEIIVKGNETYKPIERNIIFLIIIIMMICIVVFVPKAIADQRFVFDNSNLTQNIKIDFQFSGLYQTIFAFGRFIAVLMAINYFYKRNLKKESFINVVGAFFPVILNCLWISNLGRTSIFIPLVTFSSVIITAFNSKKSNKRIIRLMIIVGIILLTYISMNKFFGEGRGNVENAYKAAWWGDTLNMYFSGAKEIAVGIDSVNLVEKNYGNFKIRLFFNDIFSNVIGLSNFTNHDLNSRTLYNYTYFGSDVSKSQIPPNIIEGVYYFGYVFAITWQIIFLCLSYYFSYNSFKSNEIEKIFPFTYASLYCGMILMYNTQMIISAITNVSILFLLIVYVNNKIVLDNKNKKINII